MKFGTILKELRLLKGATQQCIAAKLNIERSTYPKWETDKIVLRIDQLQNLAHVYGIDLEYMIRCVDAQKIISKNDVDRFIRLREEKEKKGDLI